MPSNQTTNYQLSQWVKSDQVKMEDFNADNTKIDGALKAASDARAALTEAVAKLGNCGICFASYVGTGTDSSNGPSNSVTLPAAPAVVFVCGHDEIAIMIQGFWQFRTLFRTSTMFGTVNWSEDGKTLSWNAGNQTSQLNVAGSTYQVIGLYSA